MSVQVQFWDKIARKYAATPVRDADAYAHTLARTRSYLRAEGHVLELGCGTGTTALTLAPHVAHYRATDWSAKMIEIAREKALDGPGWLEVDVMGADVPDVADASLDTVLAFSLLHLVEDRAAVLKRVYDVLKPGGFFISKTACLRGQGLHLRVLVAAMQLVGKAPPVAFFDGATLEEDMRQAGFEVVEADDHNHRPAVRFIVVRKPG